MNQNKVPTISDIEAYLSSYGWNYKKTTSDEGDLIISPLVLSKEESVFIYFKIQGEFVMVSTLDFMTGVLDHEIKKIFTLNDRLKLVKLFPTLDNPLVIDIGFELWAESFNEGTFFAFMDMLALGIEKLLYMKKQGEITFTPGFANLA